MSPAERGLVARTRRTAPGGGDGVVGVAGRAGRVHQGKTQVWSRTAISSRCRSGTTCVSTGSWAVGSRTGFTTTWLAAPHQSRSWPGVIRWLPCSRRAVEGVLGEVDVEDDLATVVVSRRARSALLNHRELQRQLTPGQLTDRHRAAYVEGLVGAEVLELGGHRLDRVLQLHRVGDVELAVDGQGAVEGVHLPGLDGEVPAVRAFEAATFGFLGHVAADRLVDQPVELDRVRSGAPSARRAGPQTQPRPWTGGGSSRRSAAPATAADHPSMHPPPHPGQPVPELEGVADVPLPRIRRHPQRRGELGHRELRHPRRTLTRDRHPRLAVRTRGQRLGLQDRVHASASPPTAPPPRAGWPRPGRRSARCSRAKAEHRRSGVEVASLRRGHGSTQAPTTDTQGPRTPWLSGSVEKNFRTATTAVDGRSAPRAGQRPQRHRNQRRRATTPIDNRGDHPPAVRGLDKLGRRGGRRPAQGDRVSTSSADVVARRPAQAQLPLTMARICAWVSSGTERRTYQVKPGVVPTRQ